MVGKRLLARGVDQLLQPSGRRLKHWMSFPLISPERINARLDAVEW